MGAKSSRDSAWARPRNGLRRAALAPYSDLQELNDKEHLIIVDGAFISEHQISAVGCVVINPEGHIQYVVSHPVRCSSSLEVEAKAVVAAVSISRQLSIQHFAILTDCKEIIDIARKAVRAPNKVVPLLFDKGRFLVDHSLLQPCSRGMASVAGWIANESLRTGASLWWTKDVPAMIQHFVSESLAQAGLESSNLIVGIDFTKSNEWTGRYSFNRRSLHHMGDTPNPYEQAISIIGRTLSAFNGDKMITCFGFGDASTHDQDVFSFYPNERPCNGFSEALERYREIVPHLKLSGPTSFAPIIEMAMNVVERSGGQYHVLLIIADGQVTRALELAPDKLSPQEQKTFDAIVKASELPLSIILVGVGDGPWDMIKEIGDIIPTRSFNNFLFVNFTEIMSKNLPQTRKESEFALSALMGIPLQYKATLELGTIGYQGAKSLGRTPLPPPLGSYSAASSGLEMSQHTSFQQSTPNEMTEALAGLESSNIILGIDFTKSNEWEGRYSFNGRSLHHIGDTPNPYEKAISIIGQTLSVSFDGDSMITCFGFGDASTYDRDVFSFYPDERTCNGFSDALERYREIVPHLRLAGPTSFAPIIEMAMTLVQKSGGQYHLLLIIADGQVTRSPDTGSDNLSSQEQKTLDAIVEACNFPLSIVLVGVGDGPWDMMKEFVDSIPARSFDNFQFVNFTEIMSEKVPRTRKESEFALAALQGISSRYRAMLELDILGRPCAKSPERVPLPPPLGSYPASSLSSKSSKLPHVGGIGESTQTVGTCLIEFSSLSLDAIAAERAALAQLSAALAPSPRPFSELGSPDVRAAREFITTCLALSPIEVFSDKARCAFLNSSVATLLNNGGLDPATFSQLSLLVADFNLLQTYALYLTEVNHKITEDRAAIKGLEEAQTKHFQHMTSCLEKMENLVKEKEQLTSRLAEIDAELQQTSSLYQQLRNAQASNNSSAVDLETCKARLTQNELWCQTRRSYLNLFWSEFCRNISL